MHEPTPLIRDIAAICTGHVTAEEYEQLGPITAKEVIDLLCPHGVVLGGIYRHFKGGEYRVVGITRDAGREDYPICVRYVDVKDASHEATRPVDNFLGDVVKPNYRGPRFRLVRTDSGGRRS